MKINNKFLSNVSWIMLGRIAQLVLTFVTTMLVTRYLGPEQYGIITYTYSYVALFLPLCTLGLNDIAVKEFLDNKDKTGETLGTIVTLRFLSSLLSVGLIYIVVSLFDGNEIFTYIAFLQSLALVFQIFDTIIYFYQSQLLAKNSGIIMAVSYCLTAVFRIVGLVTNKNIEWFAFAVSSDYLVISILLLVKYFIDGNTLSFSICVAKHLLNKSKHYILSGILLVIYGKVTDTLFLGKIMGSTMVGYYSAATTLCNAWPFILTAIIDSAGPLIIEQYKNNNVEEYRKELKKLYSVVFYLAIIVALVITIFAKYIITILYGSNYLLAVTPLRIVCWNSAFAYIGVIRYIWLQCENKTNYETSITLFGAITSIVLNYIFIKNYGVNGAAIALTTTQFLTNFIYLFIMKGTRENAKLILEAILLKDVFK